MQHKLITIYLTNDRPADTEVVSHVGTELSEGWTIKSVTAIGAGVGGYANGFENSDKLVQQISYAAGWMAVVLEKP